MKVDGKRSVFTPLRSVADEPTALRSYPILTLRNNLTPAEARFWKAVQNKIFEGRKFRRQHSVGNYILDFYCPSEKLAIELDGEVHFGDAARQSDYERRLFLEYYGIKVLRFENKLVFDELEWVLGVIKSNFGWNERLDKAE